MSGRHDPLRKPRRFQRPPRLIFLLLLLVIIGLAWFFIFLNDERFVLQTIEVSGNRRLADEPFIAAAREVLAGRRWFFFRRDNFWFYSPKEVAAALGAHFNRLASVAPSTAGWNTLHLNVVERQATALWCPDPLEALSLMESACFYLDQGGLAFARAPRFSSSPLVVLTGLQLAASSTPAVHSQPWPRSVFARLLDLTLSLEGFFQSTALAGVQVRQITANNAGDYEFYLADIHHPVSGFNIIIAQEQTAVEILTLLRSVLAVPVFQEELTAGQKLEYLDLRFDRKVFYRFRK